MSQRKADSRPSSQPSALLMLSSEEMSFSLLGGLDNTSVPSLLAVPAAELEPASQLFLTEEGDVDNFVGQTSTPPTISKMQPSKPFNSTIASFLPNPFSSTVTGGANHNPPRPSVSSSVGYQGAINQTFSSPVPPFVSANASVGSVPLAPKSGFGVNSGLTPSQFRHVGKFQHAPLPNTFPPQQPTFQQQQYGTPLIASQTQQQSYRSDQIQPQVSAMPPFFQEVHGQTHVPLANFVGISDTPATGGSVPYRPIEAHWFYTKKIEGKFIWMPFSFGDSRKLEESLSRGSPNGQLVSVNGGRFDVDVDRRLMNPVYWAGRDGLEIRYEVRRCMWFFRPEGENHFVPYDEKFAAGLEESYKQAILTSDFHKRLAFPSGETIIIHSPTAIVHYPASSQPDAWGNAMGESRPQVVRRGMDEFENVPKDEKEKIDHLVFVVLGLGNTFGVRNKNAIDCVDDFRLVSEQMLTDHFVKPLTDGLMGRVEFIPVLWSHDHIVDDVINVERKLKTITLGSIGKLRHFTNDVLSDLMMYTSPSFAQRAVEALTKKLNGIYETFAARNSQFKGGVSIVGHGIGSLVVYDILANQGEDVPDEFNEVQSSPALPRVSSAPQMPSAFESTNRNDVNPREADPRDFFNGGSPACDGKMEVNKDGSQSSSSPPPVSSSLTLKEVLEKLEMNEYEEVFVREKIDSASLVLLEESDIKEIGLPLGPRKKLQEFIREQKLEQSKQKSSRDKSSRDSEQHRSQQQKQQQIHKQQHQQQQLLPSLNNLIEDGSDPSFQPAEGMTTSTFRYLSNPRKEDSFRGIDTLVIKYPLLKFSVENFFALGSPVALVLAMRGTVLLGEDFRLPTCPGYYNIFHPFDPLAYRMEPLVLPYVPQKAVLVPHHKGRKRLHLELKESLARIGFDIKQRIMESVRSTWRTINNFASGYRGAGAPTETPRISDEDVDREVSNVLTEMQKDVDDSASVVASSVADDSDFPVGSLNQGRRVDYVLQEKPIEIFNDYLFALASSSCYWTSEDTVLMMLKEIYLTMGIVPHKPGVPIYPSQPGFPIAPPPRSGFVQPGAPSKYPTQSSQSAVLPSLSGTPALPPLSGSNVMAPPLPGSNAMAPPLFGSHPMPPPFSGSAYTAPYMSSLPSGTQPVAPPSQPHWIPQNAGHPLPGYPTANKMPHLSQGFQSDDLAAASNRVQPPPVNQQMMPQSSLHGYPANNISRPPLRGSPAGMPIGPPPPFSGTPPPVRPANQPLGPPPRSGFVKPN